MRWPQNSYAAATVSGIALVVATRVDALGWLSFCFLLPTLYALRGASTWRWASTGAWLFFVNALGSYYWIYHVSYNFGGVSKNIAIAATILFALLNIWQGLIGFGLFRWLDQRSGWHPAYLFTLIFVTAWHWVPAIFSWDFSLTLLPYPILIQSLDLIGAVGLDLIIIFTNLILYECLVDRRLSLHTLLGVVLIAAICSYSYWRMNELHHQQETADTARVSIIQPNIDSRSKANPHNVNRALDHMTVLSNAAQTRRPELIVWPEALFAVDYQRDPNLRRRLRIKTREWQSWLIFGNDHFTEQSNGEWLPYNAATLVGPRGQQAQHYYKHELLAFGEYIPGRKYLPWLTKGLAKNIGNFGRGEGPATFHTDRFRFAPIICYESIRRDYMRRVSAQDVDFVVELTNDGWYGRTPALAYHKDLTRLRAIENRISIVRGTNTGISTFIDPLGNEHRTLPIETADSSTYDVSLWRPHNWYQQGGHYAIWGLLGLALLASLGIWARSRRYRRESIHITTDYHS